MSSRAIIARSIKNGFFSSWCWVNGEPENIGVTLRTYFTSEEDVEELLSYKSILGIFVDPEEDRNQFIDGSYQKLENGLYVKVDDGRNTVVSGGLDGFFHSLIQMMKERVRYVYVYDNGTWLTYIREYDNNSQHESKKAQYNNQAPDSANEDQSRKIESGRLNRHRHKLSSIQMLKENGFRKERGSS